MKRFLILSAIFLISAQIIYPQIINKKIFSARITGYNIEATLDPVAKTVRGNMETYWINTSSFSVPDIQMHLYLNAFRSSKSTFYKESGGKPGKKKSDSGWIEIKSLTERDGSDLIPATQYISPDDGNSEDMTVLKINLPNAANQGDTVFLKINFESPRAHSPLLAAESASIKNLP